MPFGVTLKKGGGPSVVQIDGATPPSAPIDVSDARGSKPSQTEAVASKPSSIKELSLIHI